MAKEKYEQFSGPVCEALRNRGKIWLAAQRSHQRASKSLAEATNQLAELGKTASKARDAALAMYGEAKIDMDEANKRRTWAAGEMVDLTTQADGKLIDDDVEIKKSYGKKKKKDPAQTELEGVTDAEADDGADDE